MIKLSKSSLSIKEKLAVSNVLDREFLGMGQEVQEFEKNLTNFFGRPAVVVANGTAAIQLAIQSSGIGVNDEVLVQSLTYVASFQAISASGAKPIACDVEPDSLCINWRDAEKRLTENTKAIMPVHYGGAVGKLDEIYKFASANGLLVIEDAAHAFGSNYKGNRVGSFGDIACFSFDGIKNITSGEGGCVVSSNEKVIQKIRDARLLGVEKDTDNRFLGRRSWEFDVRAQGWRYHMSNIMASIGIEQLKRFEELASKRRALAKIYDSILVSAPIDRVLSNLTEIVPHIYPIILHSGERSYIREQLLSKNIETGIHYQPNHTLSLFKDSKNKELSVTSKIYPKLMSLPLHPDLTKSDIEYVCKELIKLL
jgi:dTDP-4-amino-4,6-dideoxygalactose transaminase